MSILITGHSGFIGKYLVAKLQEKAYELKLADLSNGIDVCHSQDLEQLGSATIVIHLANLTYVPASFADPRVFYETNFQSTLNVLEFCRKHNARLIYLSSYMYGVPNYQPIDEDHPKQAFNPYSQTKIICENLCEGYHRDFNVPITIFRPFNIYGKGQNPNFLVPQIIEQARQGKIMIKDERPKRDYIHVEDAVRAIIKAVEKPDHKGLRIYNLGTGVSYSVREVIDIIRSHFKNEVEYVCSNETRPNEVMDTRADITCIKNELGWEPRISLSDGIKTMIEN